MSRHSDSVRTRKWKLMNCPRLLGPDVLEHTVEE